MMATRAGAGPARRWPRFAVVLAAVFVVVALVAVYFALRPPPRPAATPSPVRVTATRPSPSVAGAPTVLADGCLGGTDPIKAIRIAHETAPLTPEGAAAFVATLARWQGQVPHDADEYQATGKLIWAPSLPEIGRRMPTPKSDGNAWINTDKARYRVTLVARPDVTLEAAFLQTINENGAETVFQQVGRFTVTDIGGHWALKAVGPTERSAAETVKQLQAEGLPYRGAC